VYGCPSNAEMTRYAETLMREVIATWRPLDTISFNHPEYPFWPKRDVHEAVNCFCDACFERAAAKDLDLAAVRDELQGLYDRFLRHEPLAPSARIEAWVDFRLDSMTEHLAAVVAAGRERAAELGREIEIGIEFLPPTASRFVGTDYRRLAPLFDWFAPKFPDYFGGAVLPMIADGVEAVSGTPATTVIGELRRWLNLGPGPETYEAATGPDEGLRYANGFDPAMIDLEVPKLKHVRGPRIYPYFWEQGGDAAGVTTKRRLFERRGFDGFLLWGRERNFTPAGLQAFADAGWSPSLV
jgi:hypothetical protein